MSEIKWEIPKSKEQKHLDFSEIEKFIDVGHAIAGHGTNIDAAKIILREGIKANEAYSCLEILKPLSGISLEETYKLLTKWPHKNAKAIVIVSTPNKEWSEHYSDMIEDFFDEESKKNRSYIRPELIRGYYDVAQGLFIENPKWESAPKPPKPKNKIPPKKYTHKLSEIPTISSSERKDYTNKEVW